MICQIAWNSTSLQIYKILANNGIVLPLFLVFHVKKYLAEFGGITFF